MPKRLPAMALLVGVLLIAATGCVGGRKDITRSEPVRAAEIVGQCVMLERDAKLYRLGKPFPRLVIEPRFSSGRDAGGPPEYVAELSAGTRLRIERVVNAPVYFDGWFSIVNDVTFARIETGHQAGRLVDLGWQTYPRSKEKRSGEEVPEEERRGEETWGDGSSPRLSSSDSHFCFASPALRNSRIARFVRQTRNVTYENRCRRRFFSWLFPEENLRF